MLGRSATFVCCQFWHCNSVKPYGGTLHVFFMRAVSSLVLADVDGDAYPRTSGTPA